MALAVTFLNGEKQGAREVFTEPSISVGRAVTNRLRFGYHDTRASGRHAEIAWDGQRYVLRDIGSTNGTFVKGKRVERVTLDQGMIVEFGPGGPRLRFEVDSGETPSVTPDSVPVQLGPIPTLAVASTGTTGGQVIRGNRLDTALLKFPTRLLAFDEVYPYTSRLKTTLILVGGGGALVGLVLFLTWTAVFAVPVGLSGLITFVLGWLLGQRYIAITAKGVQRQNLFTYESIRWDKIIDLRVEPDADGQGGHDLYVIRGEPTDIKFRTVELQEGEQLVALLAARTGLRWAKE
jgi:hypothetical protein